MRSRAGTKMNTKAPQATSQSLPWTIKNRSKCEILKKLSDVHQKDLKTLDNNGNTALHLVLLNKTLPEEDIIELLGALLDRGSDIDAGNKRGKAVIRLAVDRQMRGVVDFLTRRDADINKCDSKGNTVAHDFVRDASKSFYDLMKFDEYFSPMPGERESADFAEYLIGKGADFEVKNDEGSSALKLAIEHNLQHVALVLVKHTQNARVSNRQHKLLLHAFLEKNAYCRDELYKRGSRKLWYSDYTSRYAADIVRSLLFRAALHFTHYHDPPPTCLQKAMEYREDISIIETLVNHRLESIGQDSATKVFSELLQASSRWAESRTDCYLKILESLMSRGANVNGKDRDGVTPIYRAVHDANRRLVDFLSERGADFAARNATGDNLFHALADKEPIEARDHGEIEGLFDLVASKRCCDVNARNAYNETPLHLAVRSGNSTIARKLVESGAEVNSKDDNGLTPLHQAVHCRRDKLAGLLLKSGADVNGRDKFGRRPLDMAAAESDRIELVTLFLEWGAYVNAQRNWESPFWEAIRSGHDRQVKVMLAYGANVNNVVVSLFKSLRKNQFKPAREKELLLRHWIKLKAAGMPCSKKYEIFERKSREDCERLYNDCSREIETLKGTFVDHCTSIYSFLRMDFGYRRNYVNGEKLRQLVESPELERRFPRYSVLILASYRETVLWESLLGPAKRAWLQLTSIELPDKCIERIIAYLRNEDLVSMIEHDGDVIDCHYF